MRVGTGPSGLAVRTPNPEDFRIGPRIQFVGRFSFIHYSPRTIKQGVAMSKILTEVLQANSKYSDGFGSKADLALLPARGFAILTCMDARLDPAKYAGLAEGDAHVIRNAGGRASDDAIRSL